MEMLRRHWFLLLLVSTVFVGSVWADRLSGFEQSLPRNWVIGSVLLAMALPLKVNAMWATLRRPLPAFLATAINFVVVPLLAWCASLLLEKDLARGLIIAAAVPCTLASAAVWTRLAGGNDAVSLLVTMITNLSCFLVTPALIRTFAQLDSNAIPFSDMALKLLLLIVLPIASAQLLRLVPQISNWATTNKGGLSVYAQLGILSIVFVGAVNCGTKVASLSGQLAPLAGQIVLMIVLAALVHSVAWWFGYWTAGLCKIDKPKRLAVAFSGSQKTLMVGLAIALPFGGLTILPMLVYHIEQLFIDTLLAQRFKYQESE